MSQVNRYPPAILAALGTLAALIKNATYAMAQGELAVASDTQQLFIGNSSLRFAPVQTLDMAVVDMSDGNTVTDLSDGSIVFTY
jgi:predicted ABC-type sugar transport system permease subunit